MTPRRAVAHHLTSWLADHDRVLRTQEVRVQNVAKDFETIPRIHPWLRDEVPARVSSINMVTNMSPTFHANAKIPSTDVRCDDLGLRTIRIEII